MSKELWFNRPVTPLKQYTVPTDLGDMTLTVYPAVSFDIYGEIKTVINRIAYTVHVYADLDLRNELWRVYFKTTPYATKKANEKVWTLKPLVMEWLDNHPYELFAGHSTALASQLERANHKLDDILEQVTERRAMIKQMQTVVAQGGTPQEKDIELLMDLYSNRWRF